MLQKLLRGTLVSSLTIGLYAAFEYVYFVVAGQLLSPADFGLLSSALAVLLIVQALVTAGLATSVAKFVAEKPPAEARRFLTSAIWLQLAVSLAGSLVLLLARWGAQAASGRLADRLADLQPLLLLMALILPAMALASMLPMTFQGLHRFPEYGLAQLCSVLLRVAGTIWFLRLGLGVSGALLAFLLGAVGALVFCALRLRPWLSLGGTDQKTTAELARFSLPAALSLLLITLFMRSDVVFLKLFLPSDHVNALIGQYTPPAILGRTIFYISCGLPMALLPTIAAARELRRHDFNRLLAGLLISLALVIALGHCWGGWVLRLAFPAELQTDDSLLTLLLFALSGLTVAYVTATALIALGRPGVAARGLLVGFVLFALAAWALIPGRDAWVPALGVPGVAWALAIGASTSACILWRDVQRRTTRPAQPPIASSPFVELPP